MVEVSFIDISTTRKLINVVAKSNYKSKTTANNVTILIPVPNDSMDFELKCLSNIESLWGRRSLFRSKSALSGL